MRSSDLVTLYAMSRDLDALRWAPSERSPEWVSRGSCVADIDGVRVYVGAWIGFRLLRRTSDLWEEARVVPPPRPLPPPPRNVAHRLTTAGRAKRR